MRNPAPASAQARFVFWIRPASLNARLGSANRTGNCDSARPVSILEKPTENEPVPVSRSQQVPNKTPEENDSETVVHRELRPNLCALGAGGGAALPTSVTSNADKVCVVYLQA